jgi:hypothetical protein
VPPESRRRRSCGARAAMIRSAAPA